MQYYYYMVHVVRMYTQYVHVLLHVPGCTHYPGTVLLRILDPVVPISYRVTVLGRWGGGVEVVS